MSNPQSQSRVDGQEDCLAAASQRTGWITRARTEKALAMADDPDLRKRPTRAFANEITLWANNRPLSIQGAIQGYRHQVLNYTRSTKAKAHCARG